MLLAYHEHITKKTPFKFQINIKVKYSNTINNPIDDQRETLEDEDNYADYKD